MRLWSLRKQYPDPEFAPLFDAAARDLQSKVSQLRLVDPSEAAPAASEPNNSNSSHFPPSVSSLLKAYFYSHMDDPYPSASEKERLAFLTGLEYSQIGHALINWRMRKWRPKLRQELENQTLNQGQNLKSPE